MATLIDSLMISIGVDPAKAKEGFNQIGQAAEKTDAQFSNLAGKWSSMLSGLFMSVVAPIAGAIGIGKMITSYMNDVAEVATLTGAYNQKLEEWRLKRAQLARVTKEDIELYKKQREALTTFKIAMGDLSANMMRSFMPVMKLGIDLLNGFSKWITANQDNIVRFLQVTAGVLTAVFLPAILKTSAAMLASPLTWVVGALGLLVVVIDDLVTYLQGGKTALTGFWSIFGTGPEIMAKLNSAFTVFKEVLSVIWKPLAVIAAGFAAFKVGSVLVGGLIKVMAALKAALTAISAHPIIAMLVLFVALVTWIADAWKRAGGEWSAVLGLMKSDLKSFLNLFGGLGDTLAQVFAPLEAWLDNGVKAIGNFFGVIINAVKLVFAYLTGASDEAKDKIAAALWDCVGGLFEGLMGAISEVMKLIGAAIGGLLSLLGEGLAALPGLLFAGFTAIMDLVKSFIGFVLSGLTQLYEFLTGSLASVAAGIAAPFKAVGRAAMTALSSVREGVANLFSGMVDGIVNAWDILVADMMAFFGRFKPYVEAMAEAWDSLTAGMETAWLTLTGAVSDALNDAAALLKRVFMAPVNAVVSAFEWLYDTVTGLFGKLKEYAAAAADGIGNAISAVADTISEVIGSAVDTVSSLFSSMYDTVAGIFSSVSEAVSNAFDSALQAAQGFFDAVMGFFTKIPELIYKAFDIGGMIEGATNKLKEGLGGAWDKVTGFFGGGDKEGEGKSNMELIAQNNEAAIAATPVAAQTSSIVTNEHTAQTNNSSAKSNVNNITINTNSDHPQAIARAVSGALPDEDDYDYGYVSAADNGNFNY